MALASATALQELEQLCEQIEQPEWSSETVSVASGDCDAPDTGLPWWEESDRVVGCENVRRTCPRE